MADKMIQTFIGATTEDALRKVKQALGKDAFILHTKTVKKGGFFGLGAKTLVEICATNQSEVVQRYLNTDAPRVAPAVKLINKVYGPPVQERHNPEAKNAGLEKEVFAHELAEIKTMIRTLQSKVEHRDAPVGTEELTEAYIRLLQHEVAEVLARGLVERLQENLVGEQLRDEEAIRRALVSYISKLIPASGGIKLKNKNGPTICMFVGPTGVGKTTTISKLAAYFSIYEKKKVGLLTADTFRMGAEIQLRQYADIMKIPMKVISNSLEADRLIKSYSQMDLVLIDTAGRSQRDSMKMNELGQLIDACRPDEIHLVLNGVSQPGHLNDVIEQFSRFRIDRILITKLDEAINFGIILNVVAKVHRFAGQAQLSYITKGQSVPNDFEIGDSQRLAELIMGDRLDKQP